GLTEVIKLNRGIKQGCPLSPILFIIFLDPLLTEINKLEGYKMYKSKIKYNNFGFADDITFISKSQQYLQSIIIPFIEKFSEYYGLNLNIIKTLYKQYK